MKKICLSLILVFSFSAYSKSLPVKYFVQHGNYLDMQMSPDGEHFAARVREDGRVIVIFIRTKDWKIINGIKPGKGDEIKSVTWVNNERVVYSLAEKHYDHDSPSSTGELFGSNIDGSKLSILYGYRAGDKKLGSRINKRESVKASQEILNILPNDKKNILILERPWEKRGDYYYLADKRSPIVSKLNVYTGRKRKIETIPYPGAHPYANDEGEINFVVWQNKENETKWAYRTNKKEPWQDISESFGFSEDSQPIGVNHTGEKAYIVSSYGEKGIETLYELDLATSKHHPLFDHGDIDINSWTFDHVTNEPIMAFTYPDKVAYHYIDSASDLIRSHKMLAKAFKDHEVIIADHTDDGKKLLVHISSDTNPGEYYIFNTETKKAEWLWVNKSWIDPLKMSSMTPIELLARDGVLLKGYLTLPKDKVAKNLPLVVLPHGGPHGPRDIWAFDYETQLLASNGYAVLQINFRGSGGYGNDFMQSGYKEWGGKMIDDIIDATEWTIEQGYVDGNRACIYGASYGGYASLMASVRAPDLYQCAIGYVGVYNLELMFTKGDIPDSYGGEAYLKKVLGQDVNQLKDFSPINHVEKIKSPILLIHGGKDQRVPLIHSKKMQKALKDAGKDSKLLVYKISGHGVWDEDDRVELYTELLHFLDQHIGNK